MLKHFRNLVDEKASKANFLAAFKGKQGLNSRCEQAEVASELDSDSPDEIADPMELDSEAEGDQEQRGGHAKPMEEREPDGNESTDDVEELSGDTPEQNNQWLIHSFYADEWTCHWSSLSVILKAH